MTDYLKQKPDFYSIRSILIFIMLTALSIHAQDTSLIAFELKDQFGKTYTAESWSDSILILLGSDKDGSAYISDWQKALEDSLQNKIGNMKVKFIGLSDLRGVPFFLKGFVRGKFPRNRKNWVLMDWKGIFPKAYNFEAGSCNIIVFDSQRKRVYQAAVKEMASAQLQQIVKYLKALPVN